jgi:hypothetical protein
LEQLGDRSQPGQRADEIDLDHSLIILEVVLVDAPRRIIYTRDEDDQIQAAQVSNHLPKKFRHLFIFSNVMYIHEGALFTERLVDFIANRFKLFFPTRYQGKSISFLGQAPRQCCTDSVGSADDDAASAWIQWCSGKRFGVV